MTREELLKMLGLDEQPERHVPADEPIGDVFGRTKDEDVEITSTVLKLTDWDMEQGERLQREVEGTSVETMGDFFNLFFAQRPTLAGQCSEGNRQEFIEAMLESEAWRALHETTRANVFASDMAAKSAAKEFVRTMQREEKREESQQTGVPGEPGGDATEKAMRMLVAAQNAIDEAQEEVDAANDMVEAMGGCGLGPGGQGSIDEARLAKAFQRVRNNAMLRAIFDAAGRYRRAARARQRVKSSHGSDEVVGVTTGDHIERLVPSELGMLADEDLELDALRRLVERQAMQREMRGSEKTAKGPIVVVVDESGSMSGKNIVTAKALALAMGWIARHQKRWIALIGFSGGRTGTLCVQKPGQWDELALMDWLTHFYGGGTTLDVPLRELPFNYWPEMQPPKGKTDVIIITDAQVRASDTMKRDFNGWKKREQVKTISLVLGARAGDLNDVSDEVHELPDLDLTQVGVQSCFDV